MSEKRYQVNDTILMVPLVSDEGNLTGDRVFHKEGELLSEDYLIRNRVEIPFLVRVGTLVDIGDTEDAQSVVAPVEPPADLPILPPADLPVLPPIEVPPAEPPQGEPEVDLATLKVSELVEMAQALGIRVPANTKKADLIAFITRMKAEANQ